MAGRDSHRIIQDISHPSTFNHQESESRHQGPCCGIGDHHQSQPQRPVSTNQGTIMSKKVTSSVYDIETESGNKSGKLPRGSSYGSLEKTQRVESLEQNNLRLGNTIVEERNQNLQSHPAHNEHLHKTRQYYRDMMLGVNDGLVSTLLLVAGVVGGGLDVTSVLLTAVSGAIAGAISMFAGEFVATKSQNEVMSGVSYADNLL